MSYQEIWSEGARLGLDKVIGVKGATPSATLGARLYVATKENQSPDFIKIGRPARFFLRSREKELHSLSTEKPVPDDAKTSQSARQSPCERDLHPLVAYYVFSNPAFNRGRAIYTKTIVHTKSRKGGYNEWLHPDMVGVYLPLVDEWDEKVMELNKLSDNNLLRLFSFELKKELNGSNYREAYFQAVSNSSWAHQGYLVAAKIYQDDAFLEELERLSVAFGIGIIHIDVENINDSKVLFPARHRSALDWDAINKLCEKNEDFSKFLLCVKIDFINKFVHASEYDTVNKDIEKYIEETFRKKS